ncbi:TetR/AcrR family transcriptional regulator [Pseudonocardia xishanensis]|uniref:HTH tetR-type domain-containing protein n=1 Tax=Pseudonocardia xishanensis TaxID=630995 RepID=A0ABP8RTV9_9PSEU
MARGPGERAGLSRAAVLEGAREVLAEVGLRGLTMRALARRLGVAPNALYSHVPGKDELVDALLDDHLGHVTEPPADSPDPLAAVAALMTSTYDVLVAAPDLVPLYFARRGARGANAQRLGVTMDGLMVRAGVPARTVPPARVNLIVHAIGSASFATVGGDAAESRAAFTAGLGWLLAGIACR